MGGFEPDLNGFLNQKQSAPTTRVSEPNSFRAAQFLFWLLISAPNDQVGGVELESNCSGTAVTLRFLSANLLIFEH